MALERVPADIRRDGGVSRMSDPKLIKEIMEAVTIPVFAKCRIGHFVEAQVLEALGVDMIDESEGECALIPIQIERKFKKLFPSPDPRRQREPRRQARLQGPLRVRGEEPGGGAKEDRGGGRHDQDKGGGRDG